VGVVADRGGGKLGTKLAPGDRWLLGGGGESGGYLFLL